MSGNFLPRFHRFGFFVPNIERRNGWLVSRTML